MQLKPLEIIRKTFYFCKEERICVFVKEKYKKNKNGFLWREKGCKRIVEKESLESNFMHSQEWLKLK